jgi:FG-GAP repeat protein
MAPMIQRRWLPALAALLCAALTSPTPPPASSPRPASPQSFESLPPAIQAAVSASIGKDRVSYHATPRGRAFRVENQRLAFHADVAPTGLTTRVNGATWSLRLAEYGRGAARTSVPPMAPVASANRVEYRRGPITEWYVNGPIGIEQGFTVATPLASGQPGELSLAFASEGDLTPRLEADGHGLTLVDAGGRSVLRYSGLTAFDATGRALPARLSLAGTRVTLSVDDAGAQYPVVIDPILRTNVLSGTGPARQFGYGVAMTSDTLVIGSSGDDSGAGAVYVFTKPAAGWTGAAAPARLTASDRQAGDYFGMQVAVAADTIVVGTPDKPGPNGGASAGGVYVFAKPAGGWATMTETAMLTASDAAAYNMLGRSVAVSGDTIVAGAANKAYVFIRPSGGWSTRNQSAKLTVPAGSADFGAAVAIDGDVIVATDPQLYAGIAYVFTKSAAGSWTQATRQSLYASDPGATDARLGTSVALAGNTIAVGAPNAGTREGAVYVFIRPAADWITASESATLRPTDVQYLLTHNDHLGAAVAIGDDTIVAGTYMSAYVFQKPTALDWGGPTTGVTKLVPWSGDAMDVMYFGAAVAMAGDTFVIGAMYESQFGAAYLGAAVPVPSLGTVTDLVSTRASQSSVDAIATSVGSRASQASIDALSTSVGGLNAALSGRASQASIDLLGVSVSGLGPVIASRSSQSSVDGLTSQLSGLDNTIASRASQATADQILTKVDKCSGGGSDDALEALRRAIESALAQDHCLVSYFLPASVGGHLELVRQIVDESITGAQAAGLDVHKAVRELAHGDAAFAAGAYRDAYEWYAKAYNWLMK